MRSFSFGAYSAGFILKNRQIIHTNKFRFFMHQTMCLQYNLLNRKNISYVIFSKFKQVSLYKSLDLQIFCWGLSFEQWKISPENSRPIRVWLWFVYKVTRIVLAQDFWPSSFKLKKRYPTFHDKVNILTWTTFVVSDQSFSCELNSTRTCSLQNVSYLSLRF